MDIDDWRPHFALDLDELECFLGDVRARHGKSAQHQPTDKGTAGEVFVTSAGAKYHSAGCRFLAKSSIPISLEEAKKRYAPCSVCNPPR